MKIKKIAYEGWLITYQDKNGDCWFDIEEDTPEHACLADFLHEKYDMKLPLPKVRIIMKIIEDSPDV